MFELEHELNKYSYALNYDINGSIVINAPTGGMKIIHETYTGYTITQAKDNFYHKYKLDLMPHGTKYRQMQSLADFLPPCHLSELTDGECLDIIYDIENSTDFTKEQKFDMISEYLHKLSNAVDEVDLLDKQ